ncbi:hypothetical protein [Streptomyces cacaoi]|uniref:Small secreted hydrophilic protein n=1 Tax=Streptomyces cacaoi TaxID=1898 RepID=A0A4Y3R073_STRCI|nr:hypothetical protein [Streptomyces cacaoi]GEB51075.1 hypothetical protein SCA03_36260 [Streptomyces cacaoi]
MHRLLAAALTCVAAAGLAVGTGLGIVAALDATPEQPNEPLVHFHSSPDEIPGLGGPTPSAASPDASPDASGSASPDASEPSEDPSASDSSSAPGSSPPGEAPGRASTGDFDAPSDSAPDTGTPGG